MDRFKQIKPVVIFTVEGVVYNGKTHDHLAKVKEVVAGLETLRTVVVAPYVNSVESINISSIPNS